MSGSNTITASVPSDDNAANNAVSKSFDVTDYDYSYLHPGAVPEDNVTAPASTTLVAKFPITAAAKVSQIHLYFMEAVGTYRAVLYADSGSGGPAVAPIYEDAADRSVTAAGPVTITLPAPVDVPAGNFYAGYLQTSDDGQLEGGIDYEDPVRPLTFFGMIPPGGWFPVGAGGNGQNFTFTVGVTFAQCTSAADCNDGNPCTDDTCVDSACVHTNNSASCDDGNACTQTDTCQSGACVGSNAVTCTASDQCHVAGTCNPSTGVCSNPNAANGTACSDGNACTQTDSCQAGTCVGGNYSWSGFRQPVNADGTSVFKRGSTIPVKFRLTGACGGNKNLLASIYFYKVSNTNGPVNEAASTSAADTGTTFRYSASDDQYIYNLGTSGADITDGTWNLGVDLHDGVGIRSVTVGLRK